MKKMIEVCDICKENKSEGKCLICGNDICDRHMYGRFVKTSSNSFELSIRHIEEGVSRKFIICEYCAQKFTERLKLMEKLFDDENAIEQRIKLVNEILEIMEKYAKIEVI